MPLAKAAEEWKGRCRMADWNGELRRRARAWVCGVVVVVVRREDWAAVLYRCRSRVLVREIIVLVVLAMY